MHTNHSSRIEQLLDRLFDHWLQEPTLQNGHLLIIKRQSPHTFHPNNFRYTTSIDPTIIERLAFSLN